MRLHITGQKSVEWEKFSFEHSLRPLSNGNMHYLCQVCKRNVLTHVGVYFVNPDNRIVVIGQAKITQTSEDRVLDMFCVNLKVCRFTDVSKSEEDTGAGIWGRRLMGEIRVPKGEYHSVFQVEIAAIMWFSQENLTLGIKNKVISIFSFLRQSGGTWSPRLFWGYVKAVVGMLQFI